MPNAWEFTDAQCQYGSIFGPAKIRYRLESIVIITSETPNNVCPICGKKYEKGMNMDIVGASVHQKDSFTNTCGYYGMELVEFPACTECSHTLISGDTDNPKFVKYDKQISELIAVACSERFKNKKEDKNG